MATTLTLSRSQLFSESVLNPNFYSQSLTLISIEQPNAVPFFVENYFVNESLCVTVISEYKDEYKPIKYQWLAHI